MPNFRTFWRLTEIVTCFTTLPLKMNTLEIDTILRDDKRTAKAFKGVYTSNELPIRTTTDSLYVCNTDPSDQPGTHWIVVYIDKQRRADYFDSFGMAPTVKEIKHFLNENSIKWIYNVEPVQEITSDACGHHCIFFAVHRCIGFDMKSIVDMYTKNKSFNDDIVKLFVYDKLLM